MFSAVRTMPRLPWVTTAVAAVVLAIHWFPGWRGALQLDFARVSAGELWRLGSCELVHWSNQHLWWDLSTFAVVGTACEREDRPRMALCLLLCLTVIPMLVYAAVDGIAFFRGLSGVDCGLFALAAAGVARSSRRRVRNAGRAALAILAAKVSFEALSGQTVFVHGDPVAAVPLAHALGATIGVLTAVVPMAWCRPIRARETPMMSVAESELAVLR